MRPLSQNASDFYRWLSELEAARSRETEGKFRRYGAALQAHLAACDDLLATVQKVSGRRRYGVRYGGALWGALGGRQGGPGAAEAVGAAYSHLNS